MSVIRRLIVRPAARQDIQAALLYSRQQWGPEQRTRYRRQLYAAMYKVLDYPNMGQSRDDLLAGARMIVVDQHVVFYLSAETNVTILRVLHVRQDSHGKIG